MSTPSSGANAAYEVILAILFAELSRAGNLSFPAAVDFFENTAARTEDEAEARVYRKFALMLGGLPNAGPVGLPQAFELIQGGLS